MSLGKIQRYGVVWSAFWGRVKIIIHAGNFGADWGHLNLREDRAANLGCSFALAPQRMKLKPTEPEECGFLLMHFLNHPLAEIMGVVVVRVKGFLKRMDFKDVTVNWIKSTTVETLTRGF